MAVNFAEDARRPERRKKHWLRGYVANDVAVTPVNHGGFREGHGDAVKRLGHAAHGREAAVDGELIVPAAKQKGRQERGSSEWWPAHRR